MVFLVVSMLPVVVLLVKNPRRGQLGILVFSGDHGGSAIDRFCLLEEDRAALVGGKQYCIYW